MRGARRTPGPGAPRPASRAIASRREPEPFCTLDGPRKSPALGGAGGQWRRARQGARYADPTLNKGKLRKLIGKRVKLDPAAVAVNGKCLDDNWIVADVADDQIALENERTHVTAILGLDAVYSFFDDPAPSTSTVGTLQLHSQITVYPDDLVRVRPLPPPKAGSQAFPSERFHPIALMDGDT